MLAVFSKPTINDKARQYVNEALESGYLDGDGAFTQRCHAWLATHLGAPTLLTHSCTAALEMAALLTEVGPGDEVIMPSYTFTSTATAFVLRGATPVFVDIREDTLNLDETLLEAAVTERTKVIVPVHYAGVGCEMDAITAIAQRHGLTVVEDAAQGHLATYKGRLLGTFGAIGCFSYHVSKNIVSGEGGAIVLNDTHFLERAHILREKGTNRTAFLNRKVDKYEWLDIGSSFLPSDLLAALLLAQLEVSKGLTAGRMAVWNCYHEAFAAAEAVGRLRRPVVPEHCTNNGHIYYILLPDAAQMIGTHNALAAAGISSHLHYVPLHSAPAGRKFGRAATPMPVTERTGATLLRLPIYADMNPDEAERIASIIVAAPT